MTVHDGMYAQQVHRETHVVTEGCRWTRENFDVRLRDVIVMCCSKSALDAPQP